MTRFSELSKTKCVGITIETRPDYCLKPHLRSAILDVRAKVAADKPVKCSDMAVRDSKSVCRAYTRSAIGDLNLKRQADETGCRERYQSRPYSPSSIGIVPHVERCRIQDCGSHDAGSTQLRYREGYLAVPGKSFSHVRSLEEYG